MTNLEHTFEEAVVNAVSLLKQEIHKEIYVKSLEELSRALMNAPRELILGTDYPEQIKTTMLSDKALLEMSLKKEADRASLVNTLAVYEACRREGMPDHAKAYMDRVTALRHKIDEYYGDTSQQFCGS